LAAGFYSTWPQGKVVDRELQIIKTETGGRISVAESTPIAPNCSSVILKELNLEQKPGRNVPL